MPPEQLILPVKTLELERKRLFRLLAGATALFAFAVVLLGAFVRLKNAGLGCPDWPGCYGRMAVSDHIDAAGGDAIKAWIEMIHRYAAGSLGIVVAWVGWRAWRSRIAPGAAPWLWSLLLFQVLLGMWTVTHRLHPGVVLLHLLGGMTLVISLAWLAMPSARAAVRHGPAAVLAAVVLMQVLLGGWTSANYAALACPDFPTCRGEWWPEMDAASALKPGPSETYEGGVLTLPALTAVHMGHRLGALLVFTLGVWVTLELLRRGGTARRYGVALGALLLLQVTLGISNVTLNLPLPVAVAHTGVALLLLLTALAAARHASAATGGHVP